MNKVTNTIMDIFKDTTNEFQKINEGSSEEGPLETTTFETIDKETSRRPSEDQLSNVPERDEASETQNEEDNEEKGGNRAGEEEGAIGVTSDGSIGDEVRRPSVKPNSTDKSGGPPSATQSPNTDVTGETTPALSEDDVTEVRSTVREEDSEISENVSGDVKESVTPGVQVGISGNGDAVSSVGNTQDTKGNDAFEKIPVGDETGV